MRNGRMILIKFSGKIGSGSWDAVECPAKLASWYRPIVDLSTVCLVSNGQTARSLTARADSGSFVGALYGGSNTITVKGNMLYVDLSSFKSTVEVSNYRVWLYQSGIRPSATIGLGCVGSSLADPHYNKQANWNPDGSITLLGGVGRDNILIQRFSMPIPSGVTFS